MVKKGSLREPTTSFTKVDNEALDLLLYDPKNADLLRVYLYCRKRANYGQPYTMPEGNGVLVIGRHEFKCGSISGAERLGMSKATFQRKLAQLEELGFISRRVKKGKYTIVKVRDIVKKVSHSKVAENAEKYSTSGNAASKGEPQTSRRRAAGENNIRDKEGIPEENEIRGRGETPLPLGEADEW